MAKLDLFSGREPHIIELAVNGEKKQFKIPTDYTEEDVERLLELEAQLSKATDFQQRTSLIFGHVQVLFRRYQPEMTVDELKKILGVTEAVKIINFFAEHTFTSKRDDSGEVPETAKKERGKS